MQTLLTCFVTRLQTKFLLLIIRASKRIYILVIGQISSFANILPANWFRLAYSPIFYPSNIFPRTVICVKYNLYSTLYCTYSSDNKEYRCPRRVSTVICIHDPECTVPDCSGHGVCNEEYRCVCHSPWIGYGCHLVNCTETNCSGRGTCSEGT